MKNKIFNPIIIFIIGLILGIVSKLFDIYTEILGNIFSEFAVWILFGTLISIYSDKNKSQINLTASNLTIRYFSFFGGFCFFLQRLISDSRYRTCFYLFYLQ